MAFLDEGEIEDYEYPDEDIDDPGEEYDDGDYVHCHECDRLIYEDAPQCHFCGAYTSSDRSQQAWVKWVAIALLILFLLFAMRL